jgi:hypothetical protein
MHRIYACTVPHSGIIYRIKAYGGDQVTAMTMPLPGRRDHHRFTQSYRDKPSPHTSTQSFLGLVSSGEQDERLFVLRDDCYRTNMDRTEMFEGEEEICTSTRKCTTAPARYLAVDEMGYKMKT